MLGCNICFTHFVVCNLFCEVFWQTAVLNFQIIWFIAYSLCYFFHYFYAHWFIFNITISNFSQKNYIVQCLPPPANAYLESLSSYKLFLMPFYILFRINIFMCCHVWHYCHFDSFISFYNVNYWYSILLCNLGIIVHFDYFMF